MPATENREPADGSEQGAASSFLSHLIELRNRLIYAAVSVLVVFIALVGFSKHIYAIVAKPLMAVLQKHGGTMIATEVTSAFLTPMKLTLGVAVVIAVPFILYQIWAFVAPGLYKHERRLVWPLLLSSTLLFYSGMAFAYFAVFPAVFGFMADIAPADVQMMTDIKAYLDFVYSMFFAFGIAFEVPIAVILLAWMGVIDPNKLGEKRPYVFLGCFVIAAVLTPPDVGSQVMLALPMYVLFEVGLLVARYLNRLKRRQEADEDGHRELTEAEMDAELDRHMRSNPRDRD